MMHISEQVIQALLNDGWKGATAANGSFLRKRVKNFAPTGTVSNGTRNVTLTIDSTGRWLARIDGWGKTERDIDLRRYPNDPNGAISAVLSNI